VITFSLVIADDSIEKKKRNLGFSAIASPKGKRQKGKVSCRDVPAERLYKVSQAFEKGSSRHGFGITSLNRLCTEIKGSVKVSG
jgi:hypothetical protein